MTRLHATHQLGLTFARMFGELVREYIDRSESTDNVYLLAVRAFHNARVYLGD